MPPLEQFSKQLADVIPTVGQAEFSRTLIKLFRAMVPFDDATILVYPGTDLPIVEYCEIPDNHHKSTLDVFVKGAFLLDPYYLAATDEEKFGVFRMRELAPSGFKEGEYYKTWYKNCGYQDECGYIISTGGCGFINIALGRTQGQSPFTKRQFNLFQSIHPTIEALCKKHWANTKTEPGGVNLRAQLHSALNAFGSSLLTERESQVINLVLHGHSTKTVAEKLSISVETVKLHRKHAYAKLEIGSQAELFYLFLDSVMSAQNYESGDTLVAYMKPPPRKL